MTPVIFQLTSFYFRFSRRAALFSIVVGLLAGAASSVLVAIIGRRISNPEPTLGVLAWAFVGIAFLDLALNVVSGLLATRLSHRTAYNIRLNLCRKILDAPLRHLEELVHPEGEALEVRHHLSVIDEGRGWTVPHDLPHVGWIGIHE